MPIVVRPARTTLLLAALAAGLAACSSTHVAGPSASVTGTGADARAALQEARARWAANRPAAGYSYVRQQQCGECDPEFTRPLYIEVRGSQVIMLDDQRRDAPRFLHLIETPTIEVLFAAVERSIDQGVASLLVEYDETYGFPRLISVDVDAQMVDDEYTISARRFSELTR